MKDDWDEIINIEEDITEAIHALLDRRLRDMDPDIDHEVRQRLNDNFRFYKRVDIGSNIKSKK